MQNIYTRREKIVGVFILSVSALLFATVVLIGRGQDWFKKHITFYTTFDESYNLEKNASVKLFKTEVGKVKDISLVENRVIVKLAILEDYANRIRSDTIATVESPTLIGDEYVAIKPGNPSAAQIPPEGEIQSVGRKSLDDFLEEFELEKTSKMLIRALQDFSRIVKRLEDPEGPFFTALGNTEKIIGDIQAGKGSVGGVLKSTELLEAILARLEQIGTILDNVRTASARAPETMDLVNDNLTTFQSIGDGLADNMDDVKRIVSEVEESVLKLKTTLAYIEEGSRDVPEITRTTRIGIQEIRDGVERVDRVFQAIEKNALIHSNLPPVKKGKRLDAGLRE